MSPKRRRTYHDPLHGAITLDAQDPVEALLIDLIDTPPFQRLRRIRQLGPASLTFHGAESSRFTHALGVMALARRAFDTLAQTYPNLQEHRATVLCAALLHDIGHGPFSHAAEDLFQFHHETWTRRIVQEAVSVRSRLDRYSPELAPAIDSVYTHEHPLPLVWQLVSSQLDCDRLDYLMRDSYFTGASYGHLDLDRILNALAMDPTTGQMVVRQKGLAAVEHYLMVRYFMYAQVYNHPKNLAATWMLHQAFALARQALAAGDIQVDDTVGQWLRQPAADWSLDTYLSADDIVFTYHLHRWRAAATAATAPLADLCRRFLDRDLFKAREVSHLSAAARKRLLATVQEALQQQARSPEIYCGFSHSHSRGYTLYQQGIQIWVDNQAQDINQVSPLVAPLTQIQARTWLIYPPDLTAFVAFWLEGSGSEYSI
ncbi:HD domain-containing protein [Leptolyngbya sp. PCC 6406]|uniref:HD domain-containing protein n=1 Tax=Leptolyngbya sp. PCC 6406 TaxID=1173264 RepID=UPI0002ACD188|nr:HD domain-containing protein [Leptolyngbya sp. PCC 6406]